MSPRPDTQARLRDTALALFRDRGYDAVTVHDIATAAGVSHMTFFRYFPTKSAVVLGDPFDPLIAEAVAAQPADLPALHRVIGGLRTAWAGVQIPASAMMVERLTIVAGHDGLRAQAVADNAATADAITEALERTGTASFDARVAADAALAALTTALFAWAAQVAGHESADSATSPSRYVLGALAVLASERAEVAQ